MEKQKVSLLKQKNRWGLTALSIVLCLLLSPVLSVSLALPQVVTLLPIVLLALLGYVGTVSAAVCCALLAGLGYLVFGLWGMVSILLFFVPTLIVSALVVEREEPFWHSVLICGVTMFISMSAAAGMLTLLFGSDVVSVFYQSVRTTFESSGALGDSLLVMLAQAGLLTKPETLSYLEESGMLTLDALTREQMLDELVVVFDSVLRLEIPMQMATGSVAAGLLGQAVLRKGVRRRGMEVEYPPLRTWLIPSGWGRVLGITLLAFYALAMFAPNMGSSTYYVFSGVFQQVFRLQGIAALCYLLHDHDKSPRWQGVVFALGYTALGSFASMVGILDQAMDFTHRRVELEDRKPVNKHKDDYSDNDGGSFWPF